jgi:replicative DNA helicase
MRVANKPYRNKVERQSSLLTQDKQMPAAPDLEQSVLGAILIDREAINIVLSITTNVEVFYQEKHKVIFEACIKLKSIDSPIDLRTITTLLRKEGNLEFVGGAYYIDSLTFHIQSAANVEYHFRILMQYWVKRELILLSAETYKQGFDDVFDPLNILSDIQVKLMSLVDNLSAKKAKTVSNLIPDVLKEIELAYKKNKSGVKFTGITTGFHEIDQLTGGWQSGDLIILAARPGMGKTTFILDSITRAAQETSSKIALFSLEMKDTQLVKKQISAASGVTTSQLVRGDLNEEEFKSILRNVSKINSSNIFIDDTAGLSTVALKAKATQLKSKYGLDMIVVDYLQLMESTAKGGNREQEVSQISRHLKLVAKELNVPLVALCQMSRAVEGRITKKPQLSDLRESGSLEQDADVVCFIHRPEYYGITEDSEGNSVIGLAEFIVEKHRNGPTDKIELKFIQKESRFIHWNETEYTVPSDYHPDVMITQKGELDKAF